MIMKIKYYLNGKLVRTSYNNYEYAITFNGVLIACCSSYPLAVKRYKSEYSHCIIYDLMTIEEIEKYLKIERLQRV